MEWKDSCSAEYLSFLNRGCLESGSTDRTVFICVPRIEHFQRHYLIFGNAIPYILFQFGDEEAGEDIEIVVTRVGVRCPVTQQVMDRPVKNTICGHYYDEKGIEQVIKNRAAKAKYVHPL